MSMSCWWSRRPLPSTDDLAVALAPGRPGVLRDVHVGHGQAVAAQVVGAGVGQRALRPRVALLADHLARLDVGHLDGVDDVRALARLLGMRLAGAVAGLTAHAQVGDEDVAQILAVAGDVVGLGLLPGGGVESGGVAADARSCHDRNSP
jgi:hypothetical protein